MFYNLACTFKICELRGGDQGFGCGAAVYVQFPFYVQIVLVFVAAVEKELNNRVCLPASGWSSAACCIIIVCCPSPLHLLLELQPEGKEERRRE